MHVPEGPFLSVFPTERQQVHICFLKQCIQGLVMCGWHLVMQFQGVVPVHNDSGSFPRPNCLPMVVQKLIGRLQDTGLLGWQLGTLHNCILVGLLQFPPGLFQSLLGILLHLILWDLFQDLSRRSDRGGFDWWLPFQYLVRLEGGFTCSAHWK